MIYIKSVWKFPEDWFTATPWNFKTNLAYEPTKNLRDNIYCFYLCFSGTNQKTERRRPFGTGLVRHCPQGLFSPFFTFLRAIFFRLFRLSLAPTICPWVSEDVNVVARNFGNYNRAWDRCLNPIHANCTNLSKFYQIWADVYFNLTTSGVRDSQVLTFPPPLSSDSAYLIGTRNTTLLARSGFILLNS